MNDIEVKDVVIMEGKGLLIDADAALAAMERIINGAEVIEA
jgi:hypothetical protein